jgi:hypothetical protein
MAGCSCTKLASSLVAEQSALWPEAVVSHVVYCTARIDGTANPGGAADQDVYLKALKWSRTADLVEFWELCIESDQETARIYRRQPVWRPGGRRRTPLVAYVEGA